VRDRILEIVVFMIDNLGGEQMPPADIVDLLATLETMGYSEGEISTAYFWFLERFNNGPEHYYSKFPERQLANRVLTEAERARFSTEAYGFLIKLLGMAIVDNEQFESVLDRAGFLSSHPMSLEQAKTLVSSVIFRELDEAAGLDQFNDGPGSANLVN
jgi:uncharacterized protein Smg (DUF494 family)